MTRDEILAADADALRDAIKAKSGDAPVGRRTLEGLQVLAGRAFGVDLNAPETVEAIAAERAYPVGEIVALQSGSPALNNIGSLMSGSPVTTPVFVTSEGHRPKAMIEVRIKRDYWPKEGERMTAGTVTKMPEAEAKPLVKAGVVEWI